MPPLEIKKNVSLKSMNTMGLQASASTFINVKTTGDLFLLKKRGFFDEEYPFVLGGGSNVLLKKEISKTVLKVSITGIDEIKEDEEFIWLAIGAGENWHHVVTTAVSRGYGGIENLALIPGTAGAAPIQNIGAHGAELKDVLISLDFFDFETGTIKTFSRDECRFGYRDSIFKNELRGKGVVTGMILKLKKKNHQINTSYYSLQHYFTERGIKHPTIQNIYDAVIFIRKSKLPDPENLGNAGSFFKNPVVDISVLEKLKLHYEHIPYYPVDDGNVKIPAGWLIEKAGWKGKRIGNVGTYENQALVIVNHGGATGEEVFEHSKKIRKSVDEKFGIQLVPEVNVVE